MPTTYRIGEWLVDPRADRIVSPDETVHIEPRAMQALVYLAEHAGEVAAMKSCERCGKKRSSPTKC